MSAPVYLDYNATTPVAPEVTDAMLRVLREHFGNPSSSHPYGRRAAQAVAEAREQVAMLIGAHADEIVFTGCATEANNLALIGVARALGETKRHLVVGAIEHPAVMAPARHLEGRGRRLTVIPVDGTGLVSPDDLARALGPDTALVSVMHSNNEVGTVQPIREIARITRERGVLLHTDAAQSAGKMPVDVDALGVDLLTLAGHKFYATKGVGALYVRAGTPIRPVLYGAGQEHSRRPGTENVPAIVGLGVAARLARERLSEGTARLRGLPTMTSFAGLVRAFVMAAAVLNSPRAIEASILVVRAFIHLRELIAEHTDLKGRLDDLELRFAGYEEELREIRFIIARLEQLVESKRRRCCIGWA